MLVLLAPFLTAAGASPSVDHYVLALNWEPAFCQINMAKPECAQLRDGDFAATHLSIHGLWPDLAESKRLRYCGLDEHTEQMDQRNRWCELPALPLSPETRAALDTAMPGARSCLDRHEWTEHGTCSGLDQEGYFAATLRLAQAVQTSALGDLLAANIGREVPRRELIDAFEASFGPGAGKALTLLCAKGRLIELRITLQPSAIAGTLGANDLRPTAGGTRGSCPAAIQIDANGP